MQLNLPSLLCLFLTTNAFEQCEKVINCSFVASAQQFMTKGADKIRHTMVQDCDRSVYCDVQNEWIYEPVGLKPRVNELLAHLRTLTWDSVKANAKQFATDYLQLTKTRWTVWDPRRGEYAFQVSYESIILFANQCSAAAQMGDRARSKWAEKWGSGGCCASFRVGELGPH